MGLIEQAAKRLEELRRAGIEAPADPPPSSSPATIPPRGGRNAPAGAHPPSQRLALDLGRLALQGFVTPDMPRTRIADEFRVIKRPLIANAAGKGAAPVRHGNLIMVTSAVPGEGKTFSAVNLAMSLAMEQDRTVLLVDADVARPSLPRVLGIPELPGLLDVLDNPSMPVSQVLHHTSVDKLSLLSSGTLHPRASEMLASDAMSAVLEELSSRYPDRLVVFDSPPLLVTTEARVLASRMGQVVMIVSAESTLRDDVRRALATIEACPIKMMVLNKATKAGQGAYGYGYGYGYSH